MKPRVRPGLLHRNATIAVAACLAIVAAGWSVEQAQRAAARDAFAEDFKTSVWYPGRAVLDGRSPLREYSGNEHNGGSVYPPAATFATLPFSLPPYHVAMALWLVALFAAFLGGLWLCGVRDWRCYVASAASPPVIAGLLYANVSLLFVLVLALVWRWRHQARVVGALVGLAIAVKLFLWPVALWLALTRRWSAFVSSIVFGALASFIAWAALGFEGLTDYPGMIRRHAEMQGQDGLSVAALAAPLGETASPIVALAAGIVALAVAASRRRDDLGSFSWTIAAALLASPMVWTHYYSLLLVPLALATPVWSLVWLSPFLVLPHALDAVTGVALVIFVACWATARRSSRDPAFPDSESSRARRRIVPARAI